MATKTYLSSIARYTIIVRPTTKRADGEVVPGKIIRFDNHRYTTSDPEEQKAIESGVDFGRLIFVDGQAPQQKAAAGAEAELRQENRRLAAEVEELRAQLAALQQMVTAQTASKSDDAPQAKSRTKKANEPKPTIAVPPGQKCEEPGCDKDAVTEADGMFVCAEHAQI